IGSTTACASGTSRSLSPFPALTVDLPGFRLFFLLRPFDKTAGGFVVHARPTPPTEAEIPADGDLIGVPQPLRQICPGQSRVPVWEMNLLPFSLPSCCRIKRKLFRFIKKRLLTRFRGGRLLDS